MGRDETLIFDEAETFRKLLPLEVNDEQVRQALQDCGMEPTFRNAICLTILRKAAAGDMTACRYVRDLTDVPDTHGVPVAAMDLSRCTDEELERMAFGKGDEL